MDFSTRLSSNHKVLNYLTSNKLMFPCVESSISNGYFPFKDQQRCRAGSDGDSSPASSLSDPIADSGLDSLTTSTSEEFDFNLTFEQISSDDDDDDKISNTSNEDYLRQTSEMTLMNDNDRASTFTLCTDELSPIVLRSNSIDILHWNNNAAVENKPSKKVVRFADVMVSGINERVLAPPIPADRMEENDDRRTNPIDWITQRFEHVISHVVLLLRFTPPSSHLLLSFSFNWLSLGTRPRIDSIYDATGSVDQ